MRYLFFAALFIQSTLCCAQKRCNFTTDGTGQSLGLKIKFTIPCDWKDEGGKGKNIKSLQYETDNYGIAEMIGISKPTKPVTPGRIDEMISAAGYKKMEDKGAEFLWGNKIKIDGEDCAEVCIKIKKKVLFMTAYVYVVRYIFYHNNTAVSISFAVTAEEDKDAIKCFNDNKVLFRSLATATDILNYP